MLMVVCCPPYIHASASASAPAFSNALAISAAFGGVFCRSSSTPFAAT